jgi:hypothetical protein
MRGVWPFFRSKWCKLDASGFLYLASILIFYHFFVLTLLLSCYNYKVSVLSLYMLDLLLCYLGSMMFHRDCATQTII